LRRQFVKRAHEIVAGGYARLDAASLEHEEETITGHLCEAMNQFLCDARSPDWCDSFAVRDDPRVQDSGKTGKRRDRVDVEIEYTRRPRPVFSFEAKSLRDSHSVATYVGSKGLGCLRTGMYASDFNVGGMLGYVCKPMRDEWVGKIQKKLESERSIHGLAPTGPVWTVEHLAKGLGDSRRSVHERRGLGPIDVYHSFLVCHGVPSASG
jgi:hypothetical protein